jgi:hypothetical protein
MNQNLLSQQLYQLAKFQVLSTATNFPDQGGIANTYIHAWHFEVYPYTHADGLHTPFEECFKVRKAEIESLVKFLDDNWQGNKLFTFYELERHFGSREPETEWPRWKLINCLRYFFLDKGFDTKFWDKLLEKSDHPVEASTITYAFDVKMLSLS